jgi:hypothetical protein
MTEVDVCYLNENGQYQSRKFERYESFDQAVDIYNKTVNKFKRQKLPALIAIRTHNNGQWTLEKSELTWTSKPSQPT